MILRKKLLRKEEKDEKACIVDRSFIRLNKYPQQIKDKSLALAILYGSQVNIINLVD